LLWQRSTISADACRKRGRLLYFEIAAQQGFC
jgi:hypothetical protein